MALGLQERCWRAWWDELTEAERIYWRSDVQRPFLSEEQVRHLRAEGLPLVTIAGSSAEAERVLMPLDLAELLDQEAAG